jgi:hypothetical protein
MVQWTIESHTDTADSKNITAMYAPESYLVLVRVLIMSIYALLNWPRRALNRTLSALVGLLLTTLIHAATPSDQADASFQKGLTYAAFWSGEYATPWADRSLQLLSQTGADWISVIVTGYQYSYTSTTSRCRWRARCLQQSHPLRRRLWR